MWFFIVLWLNFDRFSETFGSQNRSKIDQQIDRISESVLGGVFETRPREAGGRGGAPRTLFLQQKNKEFCTPGLLQAGAADLKASPLPPAPSAATGAGVGAVSETLRKIWKIVEKSEKMFKGKNENVNKF